MTAGSLLLGAALLLLVALFIGRPLLGPSRRAERLSRREALLAQKEALLARIRDLDFDLETEKLAPEEHAAERGGLMAEAATLLRQLDELDNEPATPAAERRGRKGARRAASDEIEAAVARRRRSLPVEAEIEAAVASRRAAPPAVAMTGGQKAGGFCPQCGKPADAGDRFCAYCGHQLPVPLIVSEGSAN
jgi:hypothetical protein